MSLDLILGSERGSGVKFMFVCSEWASFCDLPDDLSFMLECPGGWTGQISESLGGGNYPSFQMRKQTES